MSLEELIDSFRLDDQFIRNVAAWERLPARPARYAPFPPALCRPLVDLARRLDMSPLYCHQAEAIEVALAGEHVVLATGTASGKSLAYHFPVIQSILENPAATALYLFPTKALAQDQAAALGQLVAELGGDRLVPVSIYDGDTPQGRRKSIRQRGGVLISNPDMLHVGILPYHARWVTFFENLRYIIIDEMHTYRGVFGSHMANVVRRLRRICRFYGSDPVFIGASATIANPDELAASLIGSPARVVDQDGSPHGERHIVLYNPPLVDQRLGLRRSYTLTAREIAGRLLRSGIQTIVFARARLTTELLLGYIRDEVEAGGSAPGKVRGYRGGYLPLERRAIEQGLRDGSIEGVVATNALELGIDIGSLGAAVLAGYPGTIASTWQQFGRAGRRAGVSLGLLVASGAPLDQYIARHPRYLFETAPEHALVDPDNLLILINHLRCAVFELPFDAGEGFGVFEDANEALSLLADSGQLHKSGSTYRWVSSDFPAALISLRTSGVDTVVIQEQQGGEVRVIGEADRSTAAISVYEGAIYLHEGQQYQIEALDWENGIARATETLADFYTRATSATTVQIIVEEESAVAGDCVKVSGSLLVTSQATGYQIIRRYTHETLGFGAIDLPPQEFETRGYWFYLTPDLTAYLEAERILLAPNDYGPDWPLRRAQARARDGFVCVRCGAPERADREHDVHHVQPFRHFADPREANRLDNLQTLCHSCHRLLETQTGTRSALSGLGNILHNLATLYLMCSPNDIGVVVEQKSAVTRAATLTVYDHAPGGLGLSVRLFDLHDALLAGALELVRGCPCEAGCPACVGPVGEDGDSTKELTLRLLLAITGSEADSHPF